MQFQFRNENLLRATYLNSHTIKKNSTAELENNCEESTCFG